MPDIVAISLKKELKEVEAYLGTLGVESKGLVKKVMAGLTSKMLSKVRKSYKSTFESASKKGILYPQIVRSTKKKGIGFIGVVSRFQYIAKTHEWGRTIFSKKKKTMRFPIAGKWVNIKSMVIKPKHWFFSAVTTYVQGQMAKDMQVIADKMVQKAIKKAEGSGRKQP